MAETAQSIAFLDHFSGLSDPRQAWKVLYPLDEVMLLVLRGELAGAEGFADIAPWGEVHLDFRDAQALFHETLDNDHGRLEIRRHWSIGDIDWLKKRHDWTGLASIGMIERQVERGGKTVVTAHCHISSLPADAVLLARAHWHVENNLHWVLDVVFHDDLCRLRSGNGPRNFAVVRHIALNLLKQAKGKISLGGTRKKAGWSTDLLETVPRGTPQ